VTRQPHPVLIGMLAGALLMSGCGGSSATPATSGSATTPSSSSAGSKSAAGTATSATSASGTSAGATATSATSTGTGGATGAQSPGGSPPASPGASPGASGSLAAAIGVCKREVASATSLTAAERSQLVGLCTLAGEGNRAKLHAAERRICLTVINDSAPGVTSPALTAARESCNRF